MVFYKTDEEVELIKQSCELLSRTLGYIKTLNKNQAFKTIVIDNKAEEFIRDHGATPSFKGYNGFPYTLCISVNDKVVHGFPSDYLLVEGDLVSVDAGVILNGYHGDSAYTFEVGEVNAEKRALIKNTKECLYKGISQAIIGNRIGDISHEIQNHAEKKWLFCSSRISRTRNWPEFT